MKISEVLRLAAKRIEDGREEFSCVAILSTGYLYSNSASYYYSQVMSGSGYIYITDFTRDENGKAVSAKKSRNYRILALYMAAEVAEYEGL